MSFGFRRQGMGFDAFCKLVKRMTFVVIVGEKRFLEQDLPLHFYNVPIYKVIKMKEEKKNGQQS